MANKAPIISDIPVALIFMKFLLLYELQNIVDNAFFTKFMWFLNNPHHRVILSWYLKKQSKNA